MHLRSQNLQHHSGKLIKKHVTFHWEQVHEKAFNDLKSLLSNPDCLRYYDVKKPVTLQVDASHGGVGAALIQDEGPVAYASKAMNETQQRWAQIEKELFAVLFACKRFHQYVYGKPVTVESDHRPLEFIFRKPLSHAPPRLHKMLLQLQEYDINLVYKKGKEMYLADALSRAYPPEIIYEDFERDIDSEKSIHLMSKHSHVKDEKTEQIRNEIASNSTMQLLIQQIKSGWPSERSSVPPELKPYYPYRDELSVSNGMIYKLHNILIPPNLQAQTLKTLHQSHQGMEKTKRLARECIFWPGMSSQIDDLVSKCTNCMQQRNNNPREPLEPHKVPDRPWEEVGTDLFEWNGKDHLIIVDYFSRYPEVAELTSTKAKAVIRKFKSVFSRHGIPAEVFSDNGPQFSAQEYKDFAREYNFRFETSSPKYPQSNGLAERTIQTVKHLLEKAKRDKQDPYLVLLDYKSTPIDGLSPAQALMGRRLRGILPISSHQLMPQTISTKKFISTRNEKKKIQKHYYDKGTLPLPPLENGERIRFQKDPSSSWEPSIVIRKHHTPCSYIIQADTGAEYRRNRRHLLQSSEPPEQIVDLPDERETVTDETIPPPQLQCTETSKVNTDVTRKDSLPLVNQRVSKYGRVIKPNRKYDDFVP